MLKYVKQPIMGKHAVQCCLSTEMAPFLEDEDDMPSSTKPEVRSVLQCHQ